MGAPQETAEKTNHDLEATTVKNRNARRSTYAQVVAACIQNWLFLDVGFELAMPTLVLGALHRNPAERLNLNDDQASWFGSFPSFTHPIGSLFSGYLQERLGRKGSMILVNIPIFAAWITLYLADSVYALYSVSIIMGFCTGLSEAPLHSYIGEIAEPHIRGTLSTLSTCAVIVGVLLMFVFGYASDWRTAVLISAAFPIITIVCMTQIPESPTWLIAKNRFEEAQKSLAWLRGWVKPEEVQKEFQTMVEYTSNAKKQNRSERRTESISTIQTVGTVVSETALVGQKDDGYLKTTFRELTEKKMLRPLRLVFILFVICAFTSLAGMKPYMVTIFKEFGFPINSNLLLILGGLVFFAGSILNMIILRRFGKRKIALFSYGVATICILLTGLYCSFLLKTKIWIPVALIMTMNFLTGLCIIQLPWQLVCEVFPPMGRGTASGIAAAWGYVVNFALQKTFLQLEAWIHLSGIMYFYGAVSVFGWVYLYYYLPETEGKSLEQIESYFTKNHDPKEKFSIGKSA